MIMEAIMASREEEGEGDDDRRGDMQTARCASVAVAVAAAVIPLIS